MGIKRSLPYRHTKKDSCGTAAHNDFPIRNNKTREFARTHRFVLKHLSKFPPPFCPIPTWTRNSLFPFPSFFSLCDWMAGGGKSFYISRFFPLPPAHHRKTRKGEILAFYPESWSWSETAPIWGEVTTFYMCQSGGTISGQKEKARDIRFPAQKLVSFLFFCPDFFSGKKRKREVSGCSLAPFFSFSFFFLGRESE